jgi:(p)ppGpp synthase/HD superfamily hydrolase
MIRVPDLLVARLRDFAIARHADQHYGRHPFSAHLEQVYLLAREAGLSVLEQAAAWGHDLIEDTNTTKAEIEALAGEQVAHLIWLVTGEGENRKERVASIYRKLDQFPEGVNLKLCDRLANVSSCIRQGRPDKLHMYRKEHPEFLRHTDRGHAGLLSRIERYLQISENVPDLSLVNSPGAYSIAR